MATDFLPVRAKIVDIDQTVPDNHVFTFLPERPLEVEPGQFFEISIPAVGSFPVSSCGLVKEQAILACIRRTGRVTDALYQLFVGSDIGVRGPFGNGFPLEQIANKDALLIAGGLGMAPLRALLLALLESGRQGRRLFLLYGSRQQESLLFKNELMGLADDGVLELRFSVDFTSSPADSVSDIYCRVGLVSELLEDLTFSPRQTCAVVCGPPALYKCILEELALLGVPPELIFATLERRMRCGIGECCHCVTAGTYICRDGPVFSLQQLRTMGGAI